NSFFSSRTNRFSDLQIYVNEKVCLFIRNKKARFWALFFNIHLRSKGNHHQSDNQTRFLLYFHRNLLRPQWIEGSPLLQAERRYGLRSRLIRLWWLAREHHLNKMPILKSNTYSKLYIIWL